MNGAPPKTGMHFCGYRTRLQLWHRSSRSCRNSAYGPRPARRDRPSCVVLDYAADIAWRGLAAGSHLGNEVPTAKILILVGIGERLKAVGELPKDAVVCRCKKGHDISQIAS